VVVDAGSRLDLKDSTLFDASATIYLVTQFGVSELRNSNRLISQFFSSRGRRLQIVLNRFGKQGLGFDEKELTKALTRPAQWKIPNDPAIAARLRTSASQRAQKSSPLWIVIRRMARKACGLPESDGRESLQSLAIPQDPSRDDRTVKILLGGAHSVNRLKAVVEEFAESRELTFAIYTCIRRIVS